MADIIYCFGSGEYVHQIIEGIARIRSNHIMDGLLKIIALVGLFYIMVQAILAGNRNLITIQLRWLAYYVFITAAFLKPMTVLIKDEITHFYEPVANVPLGLALPASLISGLGYDITKLFEQNFTQVDDFQYHKYGTVFGAQMLSELKNIRLRDGRHMENMQNFIDGCVVYDAMRGNKYGIRELRNSPDVWGLVSTNASHFFRATYRDQDRTRETMTCHQMAERISADWEEAIEESIKPVAAKFAATKIARDQSDHNLSELNSLFKANLRNVFDTTFTAQGMNSASNILRQQLTINSLKEYRKSFSAVRAAQQQKAAWVVTGELARESLPIMKGIFEAIIYASFLLILPLIMLPGGFKLMANYFGLMFWLQLWAPLFAVLNLIMTMYGKSLMAGYSAEGVTMDNMLDIASCNSTVAAMAGYFSASIPFVSYAIIKGGAASFVHLAGSLSSATQSVAASAASELSSGNLSLDNRSLSTLQYANSSAFKGDWGTSYRDSNTIEQPDGGIEKITAGQQVVAMSGAGYNLSQAGATIRARDDISSNINKQLSQNESALQSEAESYGNQIREVNNMAHRITESSGLSKEIADQKTHQTGTTGGISGTAGLDSNKSLPGKIAEYITGASAKVSVDARYINDHMKNRQWRQQHNISDQEAKEFMIATDKAMSMEQNLSARYERSQNLQQALSRTENQGLSYDQDLTQGFKDYLKQDYNITDRQAQQMIESKSFSKAQYDGFIDRNVQQLVSGEDLGRDIRGEFVKAKDDQDQMQQGAREQFTAEQEQQFFPTSAFFYRDGKQKHVFIVVLGDVGTTFFCYLSICKS